MPELLFKGKEFVYNHHLSVPFRPLVPDPAKSIGDPSLDGNLIIHGDNLHALKALLPMYAGKIDCILIDPPYNTGKENWVYNDNVNSPMLKEWFGKEVGIDDGLRHDKWCAMMWPRLRLLIELLSDTGTMFIHCDDNESGNLRCLLDELVGERNWIGTIVWKNVTDNNPSRIAIEHEYVIGIAKDKDRVEPVWKSRVSAVKDLLVVTGDELIQRYSNDEDLEKAYRQWFRENRSQLWPMDRYKYIDRHGVYIGSQSVHNPGREGYRYDVIHPTTGKPCRQPLMGYRFPVETMNQLLENERIIFGTDETKIIELKVYASDFEDKLPSVIALDGRTAAYELRELFPERDKVFDTPKPVALIEKILSFVAPPGSTVLDSFAGSGTTAHATARLNESDFGGRRFILVEFEEYADSLTRERTSRALEALGSASNEGSESGLSRSFTFCTLGEPIELDALLTGVDLPDFESLASVLFHMATNKAFDAAAMDCNVLSLPGHGYLGTGPGHHVWLIYQPDLDFLKSADAALTLSKARDIAAHKPDEKHIVYAPSRFVSQKLLNDEGILVEFAPLPFALYRLQGA